MWNSRISLSSDEIEILVVVWADVRLDLSVYPAHFMILVAHSTLDVEKSGITSSVGYFTDNTSMAGAPFSQAFLIHVVSCAGDAVVRVYCNVSQLMMTMVQT